MPDQLLLERLQANLTRLRLPYLSERLADTLACAERERYSYLQLLDTLFEDEAAGKEQRRITTALRSSGLPYVKSLDEFDFTAQPQLDRRAVLNLFDLTFLTRRENVFFLGPPGVGKTHLAIALAVKASQAGYTIHCTTMAELIRKLRVDQDTAERGRLRGYSRAALVVVDEVGYTPVTREECHLFYQFVASRYERASTVITSNKAFSDWAELFHDPVLVTAVLDRLLHYSTVINIKGHSYRLRGKLGGEVTTTASS
jgi:DNA replication protein DnaC